MGKDTVISHGKDIVRVVSHSYSLSLGMARSRIGTLWRRLSTMDVRTFTRVETSRLSACLYGRKSQYVGVEFIPVTLFAYSCLCQQHQDPLPYDDVTLASWQLPQYSLLL